MPLVHLLGILGVVALFFPWFLDVSEQHLHLYNSDVIHPFLLLGDLQKDVNALSTWHHSPAPYVFPDWVLSGALVAMDWPGALLPLAYASLVFTLYAWVSGYLLRVVTGIPVPLGAWLMASVLMLCGAAILWAKVPDISAFLYTSMGAPYIHSGASLLALWAPGLFYRGLHTEHHRTALTLLIAVVCLGTFSDMILVAWFVIPAMLVGSLHYWAHRHARALWVTAAIGLAALTGYWLEQLLHAVRSSYMASNERSISESLQWLGHHVERMLKTGDFPTMIVLALDALILLRGTVLLWRLLRHRELSELGTLELLFAGMVAAGLLAPVATGMLGSFSTVRYWMIAYLLPPLWIVVLTVNRLRSSAFLKPRSRQWGLALAAILGTAIFLREFIPLGAASWERNGAEKEIVNCLRKAELDAGLSDYWNAKLLMLLSNRSLHMVQVTDEGIPFRWNTNEAWLHQRTDSSRAPEFHFILPRNLDEEQLRQTYGEPDTTKECHGQAVWIYERPIHWR